MSIARTLFKAARVAGDLEAASNGPDVIGKRYARRKIRKALGINRLVNRLYRLP